ncbi:16481_t:CDS:2 [Rhizophagus irregularis]|nr:16481_t:CDS:2 [Rhizophagus irregularis]
MNPTLVKHTQKDLYQENKVLYDDKFYLTHKRTRGDYISNTLFSICLDFIKFDESDENDEASYVKDQDKVYVKTETGYVLRSQDAIFKIEERQ